jgi:hypothetical protein
MIRSFDTGATRDTDEGKYDYDGFLSPAVIHRFGEYMHKHRLQADGALRDSDNWQKGIPKAQYVKSAWRHFMDWWAISRKAPVREHDVEEALCALMFNTMGYLHEVLKEKCEIDQAVRSMAKPSTHFHGM